MQLLAKKLKSLFLLFGVLVMGITLGVITAILIIQGEYLYIIGVVLVYMILARLLDELL
jgi:hypothetical protein